MVSYQTAWLKANHPVEFMAAVMNCDIHLTEKLSLYKAEVDRMGIEVMAPCVNRSGAVFEVSEGRILYALGALKNVGAEAMRLIVEARKTDAGEKPFATLYDFARRVDLKRVGKRPLEMLARSGAFDALDRKPQPRPSGARRARGLFGGDPRAEGQRAGVSFWRGGRGPARAAPARGR